MSNTRALFESFQENLNQAENDNNIKIANLKMMDRVVRRLNDEEYLEDTWLSLGVPDEASEEDYEFIASDSYDEMEELFKKILHSVVANEDGLFNPSEDIVEFARKYEPEIKIIEEPRQVLGELAVETNSNISDNNETFDDIEEYSLEIRQEFIDRAKRCAKKAGISINIDNTLNQGFYYAELTGNNENILKFLNTFYEDEIDREEAIYQYKDEKGMLNESDNMTSTTYCSTFEEFKNEVAAQGGLYGFVSEKYYTMPIELLKEIALNALYNLNQDEKVISDIAERLYDEEE